MKLDVPFYDLIERCNKVTKRHIQNHGGKWPLTDQLCLIHSEVSEVFDVLRRPKKYKSPELQINVEVIDILLSAITFLQIQGKPTDVILEEFNRGLKKIEKRVGIRN